jgi:AcrR family transcriptional regulator
MFKNTSKSEQTRERILKTAFQVFQEKGFEKATLRDIAATNRMSLGAVYYYFKSKEELLLAFYEQINQQVGKLYRAQGQPATPKGRFEKFMHLKLEVLQPHRRLLRIILKEAVDPESPLCPLAAASRPTLNASLELFREVAGEAGRALWIAHMALLGLWLHDRSQNQQLTRRAVGWVGSLLGWGALLAKVPGTGALRKTMQALIDELIGDEREDHDRAN